MVPFTLKVILHVAENDSKYRDISPLNTSEKCSGKQAFHRCNTIAGKSTLISFFTALAALRKHLANTVFTHFRKQNNIQENRMLIGVTDARKGKVVLNIMFSRQKPLRGNT